MPQKLCCYEKVTLKSKSGRFFFAQTRRRRKKTLKMGLQVLLFWRRPLFLQNFPGEFPWLKGAPSLYYGIKYWSHELPYLDGKPPLTILTLLVVIFSRIDSLAFKQTQGMPIDLCSSYPKTFGDEKNVKKKKNHDPIFCTFFGLFRCWPCEPFYVRGDR